MQPWNWWLEPTNLRALTWVIYAHVNPYGRVDLDLTTRLALDAPATSGRDGI
jgi:hypothetical protein